MNFKNKEKFNFVILLKGGLGIKGELEIKGGLIIKVELAIKDMLVITDMLLSKDMFVLRFKCLKIVEKIQTFCWNSKLQKIWPGCRIDKKVFPFRT